MSRSDEITAVMQEFFRALRAGDAAAIEALIASGDDTLMIGSDPDEWWTGSQKVSSVFREQLQQMGGSVPFDVQQVDGHAAGSVGWAAARATLPLPDGGGASFRITCVFERDGGGWRLVQGHASIGVPNEEALGQELAT
jgi:ketosteroid isomerase-like protein